MTSADGSGRPLRILVRSDSQGTSVESGDVPVDDPRLWASVLAVELAASGVDAEVRNASTPGMKVGDALRTGAADPLVAGAERWADVVTVTLAINDLWPLGRPAAVGERMERMRPVLARRAARKAYRKLEPKLILGTGQRMRATPVEEVRAGLRRLVDGYRAAGRGVVLLTPYQVRSPVHPGFDGNSDLAADLVVEVARSAGVPVVDTRELIPALQYSRISEDHDHTDAAGHRAIALAMLGALRDNGLLSVRAGDGLGS